MKKFNLFFFIFLISSFYRGYSQGDLYNLERIADYHNKSYNQVLGGAGGVQYIKWGDKKKYTDIIPQLNSGQIINPINGYGVTYKNFFCNHVYDLKEGIVGGSIVHDNYIEFTNTMDYGIFLDKVVIWAQDPKPKQTRIKEDYKTTLYIPSRSTRRINLPNHFLPSTIMCVIEIDNELLVEVKRLKNKLNNNGSKLKEGNQKKDQQTQNEADDVYSRSNNVDKNQSGKDTKEKQSSFFETFTSKEFKQNKDSSSINSQPKNENNAQRYDFAKAEAEERQRKAEEKRINDSIQNELSKKRVEGVQKLDKAEDDAFITAAASVLALGSLMKDEYSDDPIAFRYFLGLGIMEIPLIANTKYSGSTSKTSIEKTSHPTFNLALQATFFNDKFFNINVTPRFIYGLNALSAGVTGDHTVYGGNFEVRAGKKRDSKFKGYLEFGWEKRSGTWEHDFDASTANLGLGFSNLVLESSYDYSVLRYGAGALLDLSDGDKETTIKAGYFFEKPSFFKPSTKPLGVLNIQANLFSFVTVDFSYSVNYAAAGSIKYPSSFSHSNKNFFNLTILKNGLFGH